MMTIMIVVGCVAALASVCAAFVGLDKDKRDETHAEPIRVLVATGEGTRCWEMPAGRLSELLTVLDEAGASLADESAWPVRTVVYSTRLQPRRQTFQAASSFASGTAVSAGYRMAG